MSIISDEVSVLSGRILTEGLSMDKLNGREAVYKHIHDTVLSTVDPDADSPPLPVVVYAIRAAIQHEPATIFSNMSSLLSMVAHVEFNRAVFMKQVQEMKKVDAALAGRSLEPVHRDRHKGTMSEDIEPVTMSKAEDDYISTLLADEGHTREMYRDIVNGLSLLHVYEIWCTPDFRETGAFLSLYFPPLDELSSYKTQYLFHQKITVAEYHKLSETMFIMGKLMEKLNDDKRPSSQLRLSESRFRRRYPLPINLAQILGKISQYLDDLENAVEQVESILTRIGS